MTTMTPNSPSECFGDATSTAAAQCAPSVPGHHPPSGRILIVDDDPIILKTCSIKLTAAGYEVFTALGPSEAITAVGSSELDIIIVDVNFPPDVAHGGMPSWDGPRLMCWLRTLKGAADARYIIITGDDLTTVKQDRLSAHAIAFFQKPLDYRLLLAALAKHLKPGLAQVG
jgi:two-component system KDP operon response regulator KdpE